jgi:hypothetical protein
MKAKPNCVCVLVPVMIASLVGCTVRPKSNVATTLPTSLPALEGLNDSQYVESVAALCPPSYASNLA